MFLLKINLPPLYSLLLLLFIHAFLSYTPLFPHFPPSQSFPPLSFSLFLAPPALLTVYPYTFRGAQIDEKKKDSEGIERLLPHLFCVAAGYSFKCVHLKLTAGKLPRNESFAWVILEFPAGSGLFISRGEGISLWYSLSFHHYISPGGNS